ncbi:MAG: GNAT family N-acetyltransferase [Flavobacteriaceae bacterium]|nr:GNAT family N-acetyltransferase [Flavobacteriaceae bacterium]
MILSEKNERWFAAIIDSEFQGRKFGTQLIELAKQERSDLSGWVINSDDYIKVNGEKHKSPTDFYRKPGFEILSEVILKTDKITANKIKWSKTGHNKA